LGDFAAWDGEMVVLDGVAYRVGKDGVQPAAGDAEVPFALVTNFAPTQRVELGSVDSIEDLQRQLDDLRDTENDFFAGRVEGHLRQLQTRAVCRATDSTTLSVATRSQVEFDLTDVTVTMVGYWTPPHVGTIGIPGWHLHVLTADRRQGGHLFSCEGGPLTVALQRLSDYRLAIPDTGAFRRADLTPDVDRVIRDAESKPGP
jgi:acetolactate decarboxylase